MHPNSYCSSEGRSSWSKKVQLADKKKRLRGTRGFGKSFLLITPMYVIVPVFEKWDFICLAKKEDYIGQKMYLLWQRRTAFSQKDG